MSANPYRTPVKTIDTQNEYDVKIKWSDWRDYQEEHTRAIAVLRAIAVMKEDEGAIRVARDLLLDMGMTLP